MEQQTQQQDPQKIIQDMLNTIIANPAMERIALKNKALNFETLSLNHTLANFLKYSGFTIEPEQVNLLLSFYNPPVQQEQNQAVSHQNNGSSPLPKQAELKPIKRKINMLEAKKIIADILKKQTKGKTVGEINGLLQENAFEIGYSSLKAVLTRMRKEGIIDNDKEQGGWFLLDQMKLV